MIPYGRHDISQHDIDAVLDVLKSDFLTQGPKVPLFEKAISEKVGSKHAVAFNSATSALHVACLALDLGPGDTLWTSPISFVASANAALYCGADVDFVDIDFDSNNISVEKLRIKLERANVEGLLPKVVMPVHMAGFSCDMKAIFELSKEYGFRIIEDASHAIGASYKNESVGCCRYSDITVFSFHPVKIITTAEGGAATTNDSKLFERLILLRSHGVTRDPSLMDVNPHGDWYYQQIDLGFNYRMTEMQAALGCAQMFRLDQFVAKRNLLAKRYFDRLSDLPLCLPLESLDVYSSYHLYIIKLTDDAFIQRKQLFDGMRKREIGVNVHYIPIYAHPYYQKLGFSSSDFPESERFYNSAISIPIYPNLTDKNFEYIVNSLRTLISPI